jgi:D-3-phosphoglycerate dehydrogenase
LRKELLAAYPDAKLNDVPKALTEDELIELARDCDGVIIGLEPMNDRVLEALPKLKVVSKFGVGCDSVDFDALRRHNILFGYEAGVNKLSVAELALSFAICALRGVSTVSFEMRAGMRPRQKLGRLLTARVVGIHGCGNVGKELVRLLQPFKCTVLACDYRDYPEFYKEFGVTPVSFDELLARSEVLSLHLPLTSETRNLYDAETLKRLRPDCVLINTCRGGIVNEKALQASLMDGSLIAACFDVFEVEPPTNDDLLRIPSLLPTSHIGASADEARYAMARAAIRGLTKNVVPGLEFDELK